MEEQEIDIREAVEKAEAAHEHAEAWMRYLSLATIIIAVIAAIASLLSGTYSNQAVLEKNEAVLAQNKASDQWSYYQAKGIKKNIADSFYSTTHEASFKTQSDGYAKEQADIQAQAQAFEKQVDAANVASDHSLEKHHKMAFAVTFFQIAIALSALASLTKRPSSFYSSLAFAGLGAVYMVLGLLG